ncbi:MAG: hypothetical protein SNJ72_07210 [Fimbriimonadales bacterium]
MKFQSESRAISRRELLKGLGVMTVGAIGWLTARPEACAESVAELLQVGSPGSETLLVSTVAVNDQPRDLLNSTNSQSPTLDRCLPYVRIIWSGRKAGSADIQYRVLARSTDVSGNPLGDGWYVVMEGTVSGSAQSWFRVDITQGNWDQYRIQVTSTTAQSLFSKVVGVR